MPSLRTVLPWLAVAACCVLTVVGLLLHPSAMADPGNVDWAEFYFHHASVKDALLTQGEFPWYSPYVNGGYPLAAHPLNPSFSPFLPFTLVLGPLYGPRVVTAILYLTGVLGMALLGRRVIALPAWPTAFSASLFAVSGWLAARIAGGNYDQAFYYPFPLAVFFLFAAKKRPALLFPVALYLYMLLAEAKYAYPVCLIFLLTSCLALGKTTRKEKKRLVALLVFATIFSALAGALKIYLMMGLLSRALPSQSYAAAKQALAAALSGITIVDYLKILFNDIWGVKMLTHGELANVSRNPLVLGNGYLGCGLLPIAFALAAFSLWFRKAWGLAIIFMLAFFFSTYALMPLDLFQPFSYLPFFRGLNDPEKYFNFFELFSICLGAGIFAAAILEKARGKTARAAAAIVFIAATAIPLAGNSRIFFHVFPADAPAKQQIADRFFEVKYGQSYLEYLAGRGVISWYTRLTIPTRVSYRVRSFTDRTTDPEYRGEAYRLEDGPPLFSGFSYNRVEICGDFRKPGRVVVNLNWLPGFSAKHGRAEPYVGLVSVLPDTSVRCVEIRFRPPLLWLFAGVSIASVLAFVAWCLFMEVKIKE